jgi:hypothetical protein
MPPARDPFNVDDPPGAIEYVMSVDTRHLARPDLEAIMHNLAEAAPARVTRPVAAGTVR